MVLGLLGFEVYVRSKDCRVAQGVTLRRKDAQRAVAQLLAQGNVVLAGHALHHDLTALRLDYQPVVDTSLLFSYRRGAPHKPLECARCPFKPILSKGRRFSRCCGHPSAASQPLRALTRVQRHTRCHDMATARQMHASLDIL